MFRDVPECSGMFHVPGFIDGQKGQTRSRKAVFRAGTRNAKITDIKRNLHCRGRRKRNEENLNEESEMNTNSHASWKPSIDPDDKDNDKDNKIKDEVKSEDVKTEIKDQLKGASIKPGRWNSPEHSGTCRNVPEHE